MLGVRTVEPFEFENSRSDVKKFCNHWEKNKENMLGKSYILNKGMYLQQLPLILTLQMNQSFNKMFQLQGITITKELYQVV